MPAEQLVCGLHTRLIALLLIACAVHKREQVAHGALWLCLSDRSSAGERGKQRMCADLSALALVDQVEELVQGIQQL